MSDGFRKLIAAGPIAGVWRVGHAPFDIDDPIEIEFASGAVMHVDIGIEAATDVRIGDGPLIEAAFGHLRSEEPDTWAGIARDWTRETLDLPWLIGASLSKPRRLTMTRPYRVDVGYSFDAGSRTLALFGEADLIFMAALDDPEVQSYGLEESAPL